jgi:hypothetical protein
MSSISENPTKAVPNNACKTKSPGIKTSTVFPEGNPGTPPNPFRRGINKSKYIRGWNILTKTKTGLLRVCCMLRMNINLVSRRRVILFGPP